VCISSGRLSDFPLHSQWMNFVDMFNLNKQYSMSDSGSSGEQIGEIWNAILQVSQESKVDPRLILAVVIQEVCTQRFAFL
jgi:flagellum-specific peptidoglycan hydrolase FlgJ